MDLGTQRGRRAAATLLTAALTVALTLATSPSPLVSGPRPAVSTHDPVGDRTTPPRPHVDVRFVTHPYRSASGVPGVWKVTERALPLQFTVQRDVVDRYGLEAVREGLGSWNATRGSDFALDVIAVSDEEMDHRRRDGVNRVFLDRRTCGDRFLARAHLFTADSEVRGDSAVSWVEEVDIGICERLAPERLPWVLRHEVGHIVGLGHLCDYGSECWLPDMSPDNQCRVMSPASYLCQELTAADRDGLVYMHPKVPRVAGTDTTGTAAAASYLEFPAVQRAPQVVATALESPPDLQAAAAVLAAAMGAPHLVVDDECTDGPDGRELNRVAAEDATVLLVGDVTNRCAQNLEGGWLLQVERLPDIARVNERLVGVIGQPDTVVIVPRHAETDTGVPASVLAAPVAATLGAPLIVTDPAELSQDATDELDRYPDATVAIVLGSRITLRSTVTDALLERGVRVRRIAATNRLTLATKIAEMRDVFGFAPIRAVITAERGSNDHAAVATLAAQRRAAVIPVRDRTSTRAFDLLESRVGDALVVGDRRTVPTSAQIDASRRLDRD